MKKLFLFLLILIFCQVLVSCSKQNEQALMTPTTGGGTTCDTVNMKFAANVVPILTTNCYSCHGNGRTLGGINMDTYAKVKILVDGGSLLGAITHASGYSPMPQGAAQLSTCDINKIRDWINRGAPNN